MKATTLLVLLSLLAPLSATAQSVAIGDRLFVGISTAQVSTEYRERPAIPITSTVIPHEIRRSIVPFALDDTAVAIEVSVPMRPWLTLDVTATSTAEESRLETWPRSVHPTDPDAPDGPAVPADVLVSVESQSLLVSASIIREIQPQLDGYVRLGVAMVKSELNGVPQEEPSATMDFDSTDIRPWFALGARYRFPAGFTLNAELGAATEGHRIWRVGAGWTF